MKPFTYIALIFIGFLLFVWTSLAVLSIERDIMGAVVISDIPEGCYEYKKKGVIYVACPEVDKRVGRGKKLDYIDNQMARSGYLKMETWYMEEKKK